MAGFPATPLALSVADEASIGDSSNVTFDERVALLKPVDVSGLSQGKVESGRAMQYTNQAEPHIRTPYAAKFTTEHALTGHGSTAAGTLTATDSGKQLGRIIGNYSVAQAGTTVAAAPTSATQFGLNGGTVLSGGLVRVGAQGDARGGGEWARVNNASTITLHNALPATPNENDIVYAAALIYPYEDPTADTLVSQRMQFQTASQIYRAWGVYPQSITFTFAIGAVPKYTVTWAAAKAVPIAAAPTWPNATAKDVFNAQVLGSGSLHLQAAGTATRNLKSISEFSFTVDLGISLLRGYGAADLYQDIIGAVRTRCQAAFSFVTLAEASGTNTEYDAWNSDDATVQDLVMGLSIGRDGASLGLTAPYCHRVGKAPIMHVADDVWRVRSEFLCGTNLNDTASALTLANFCLGLA